ncbi:hypothetical protein D3C85_1374940 [compost metagenome]
MKRIFQDVLDNRCCHNAPELNPLRVIDSCIDNNLRIVRRSKSYKRNNMLTRGISSINDFLCSSRLTPNPVTIDKSRTPCTEGNHAL